MVAVHVERLDHLARLLPTPKRAKVELGSGITAGSALRYPLERLDLVEISAGVVEAAKFFIDHK